MRSDRRRFGVCTAALFFYAACAAWAGENSPTIPHAGMASQSGITHGVPAGSPSGTPVARPSAETDGKAKPKTEGAAAAANSDVVKKFCERAESICENSSSAQKLLHESTYEVDAAGRVTKPSDIDARIAEISSKLDRDKLVTPGVYRIAASPHTPPAFYPTGIAHSPDQVKQKERAVLAAWGVGAGQIRNIESYYRSHDELFNTANSMLVEEAGKYLDAADQLIGWPTRAGDVEQFRERLANHLLASEPDRDRAKKMANNIRSTQVYLPGEFVRAFPDSQPQMEEECGKKPFKNHAYAVEIDGRRIIVICLGMLAQASKPDAKKNFVVDSDRMKNVIAHEFGHHVDSKDFSEEYQSYADCVRYNVDRLLTRPPEFRNALVENYENGQPSARQLGLFREITAEFNRARDVAMQAKALKRTLPADEASRKIAELLQTHTAANCFNQDFFDGQHPTSRFIINQVLAASTEMRDAIGCPPIAAPPFCPHPPVRPAP